MAINLRSSNWLLVKHIFFCYFIKAVKLEPTSPFFMKLKLKMFDSQF
jgi:hypothetical protein